MQHSRRNALKLGSAALMLASLGNPDARAQASRDTVTFSLSSEPPTLDPTTQPSTVLSSVTLLNVFEGLTRFNESGEITPCLAESFTRTSPTEYEFRLRKGVKFHDGSPFTAQDVKFTFERNASDKSTNKRKRVFTNIEAIQTPDDHTVIVKLKKASWIFLSYLAEFSSAIVSPKTADTNATQPVGTGPYRLTNWIKGDSVTLTRFEDHWSRDKLTFNTVKIRFVGDANARVNALLSGELDVAPDFLSLDLIDKIKRDGRFAVGAGKSTDVHILCINNKSRLFSDVRMRRAVSHAIDRASLIDGAVNGFAVPLGTQMTPMYPQYADVTALSNYDPAKARKLMAEAGYPNGIDVTIKVPANLVWQRAAEIMQAQFVESQIRMKIEVLEWAQWLDVVFRQKAYDLSIVTQPDPWTIFNYTDPNYFYQYDNPKFLEFATEADTATSEAEFTSAIQAAQRQLAEDAASAWLFSMANVVVYKKELKGIWKDAPNKINEVARWSWTS